MPVSINGYQVLSGWSDARLGTGKVPGTSKSVRLRRDVLPIFLAFLSEVDKTVINLDAGPLDGFARRSSRSVRRWSNHSSGTAIDMRYDVLRADRRRHMSNAQRNQMHVLLKKYSYGNKPIFTWGGDWSSRYLDEMHVEISRGITYDQIRTVMEKLKIRNDGTISKGVVPKPAPSSWPTVSVENVQPGKKNSQVKIVQEALVKAGLLSASVLPSDTRTTFGPKTQAAYAAWQRRCGFTGADANGKPGLTSLTYLGNKYGFKATK